jgi:NarL family two-component system response regulator LiaR
MSEASTIKVLIVDDHPLTQAGLRNFLYAFPDLVYLGAADNGEQALAFCEREEPDVILMDLLMPGMGGVAATRTIKERHPKVQVIALTSSDETDLVRDALQAKAISYLLKTATAFELAYAIRAARQGRPVLSEEASDALDRRAQQDPAVIADLTAREAEVLNLVAQGLSNKDISDQLQVKLPTVKFHLRNLYTKLGVASRTELMTRVHQLGLIS